MAVTTIDVTPIPCVCGRARCTSRNRHHFPPLDAATRARVFLVRQAGRPFWSWCPVTYTGYPLDRTEQRGHYDTRDRAYADARRYTLGITTTT